MVLSNDTGGGLSYAIGGFAGTGREYGFRYKSDSSNVTFKLNDSSIVSAWEDTTLRYRWGAAYFGAVFSHLSMKAKKVGEDYINIAGGGVGGNAGVLLPVGKVGVVGFDYTTVTMGELVNGLADSGTVKMGPRADIDVMGAFNVTPDLLDVLVGYQQRTYTVTVEETFKEEYYMTYVGIRLSLYF